MEFQNRYIFTEKMFIETAKKCQPKILYSMLFILAGCMMLCMTLTALFNLSNLPLLLSGIFSLIIFLCVKNLHLLEGKRLYRKSLAKNNGTLPETVINLQENISIWCGNSKESFEYEDIVKLYETKELYIIRLKKNRAVVLRKDSFSIGSSLYFYNFITTRWGKK